LGRIAAVTSALFGLCASAIAVGAAGAASSVVVSTATTSAFGTILVSGHTVYTLKASKTPCTAQCLKIWPELMLPKGTVKATAGKGVNAAKLGALMRSGGKFQVTYAGKPLYWFSGDTAAGQVHGNVTDTWGKWSTVTLAKPTPASSGTSTTSGGATAGSGGAAF